MSDELIQLILDVKGGAAVKDLQENLDYTRATLGQLKAAYEAGELSTEDYLKIGGRLARQEQELVQTLYAVEDAQRQATIATKQATAEAERATIAAGKQADAQEKVADTATKAGGKVAGFGQSALQTGRVVQDFVQGGIGGILNNIEGLSMALGLGSGLAGILTILGVAFLTFKPQFEAFLNSFKTEPIKEFQGTIETLQGRIKELTDKPVKLSADIKELENAKEQIDSIKQGLAALEAAKTGRTPEEKAAGDAFQKQFLETGKEGKAAIEAVERRVGDLTVEVDPAVKLGRASLAERERSRQAAERALEEVKKRVAGATAETLPLLVDEATALEKEIKAFADPEILKTLTDNLKRAVADARERANKEVGNTFKAVTMGNDPIARDVMAERFRAAGQDKFADMVEVATPEAEMRKKMEKQGLDQAAAIDADNKKAFDAWKKLDNEKKKSALDQAAGIDADNKKAYDDWKKVDDAKKKFAKESTQNQVEQQIERENASIKGGGYDKLAERLFAQTRAQGGAFDRNGQFHRMSEDQILDYVKNQVARYLHRQVGVDRAGRKIFANQGMDADTTNDIATKVAVDAKTDVQKKLTGMGAAQLSNTQKLLTIAAGAQADIDRLMNAVGHQGQQINQLLQKGKARSRTPLKR